MDADADSTMDPADLAKCLELWSTKLAFLLHGTGNQGPTSREEHLARNFIAHMRDSGWAPPLLTMKVEP